MENGIIKLDRYTRSLLTIIAVLLSIVVVELAYERAPALPAAQAQIPDTAKQRKEIVEESRETNRLLSAILGHLQTKTVKVEIKTTDTRKEGREGPRVKSGAKG
ncbi:MAG TPA: hypothetical protein P5081_12470 [Phycisphaerae bacterium]|nr:hypothetical protein [Phycisphaerae bacterium]HRW53691.1 hypothetical protein [Phycisphaerae bacterium]